MGLFVTTWMDSSTRARLNRVVVKVRPLFTASLLILPQRRIRHTKWQEMAELPFGTTGLWDKMKSTKGKFPNEIVRIRCWRGEYRHG
jgi:hypothetical protein